MGTRRRYRVHSTVAHFSYRVGVLGAANAEVDFISQSVPHFVQNWDHYNSIRQPAVPNTFAHHSSRTALRSPAVVTNVPSRRQSLRDLDFISLQYYAFHEGLETSAQPLKAVISHLVGPCHLRTTLQTRSRSSPESGRPLLQHLSSLEISILNDGVVTRDSLTRELSRRTVLQVDAQEG